MQEHNALTGYDARTSMVLVLRSESYCEKQKGAIDWPLARAIGTGMIAGQPCS